MYRLLIVDDEPVILNGIKSLIDFGSLDIGEVQEASDGVQALGIVDAMQPDIVLADINMPNLDGLALARAIKQRSRYTKVAIITGYDYFDYAVSALKAGVDDYVLKPVSKKDIRQLLQKLVAMLQEEEKQKLALESVGNLKLMADLEGTKGLEYKESILRFMKDNLSNPELSLGVLAQAISLSQGYLSALFKTIFGTPFQDYLVSMRLERSKIMLLSTRLKVYEIAERVGFDDPNYFSTSFRKHVGLSPNQFRSAKWEGHHE